MYKDVTYNNNIKGEGQRCIGAKFLYTPETKLLLFELGCYKFKLTGITNKNHKTEKINSYMTEITPSFSVITLNDNRLTIPNKKQR